MSETVSTTEVTPELVGKAYEALMSGDMEQIRNYWAEDMVWLVPCHNPLSGWYHGIDGFHVLRWRDGKVREGKGAIYGDGTTEYDQFWSPRNAREGERST